MESMTDKHLRMPFDLNEAFVTYLGGADDSSAIEVGGGRERLGVRYGNHASTILDQLNALLAAILSEHPDGFN